MPILIAVSCLSPVSTQICVSHQHQEYMRNERNPRQTHLDPSHLQCMYRIRNAILEFIFDSRCPEQEHILLDQLRSTVESLRASVDRCSSLLIYGSPLAVLNLRDVTVGNAKRAQPFGCVFLCIGWVITMTGSIVKDEERTSRWTSVFWVYACDLARRSTMTVSAPLQ